MTNSIVFKIMPYQAAKELLFVAYIKDVSSAVVNEFHLCGNVLEAKMTPVEGDESNENTNKMWDVNVTSYSIYQTTLNEWFESFFEYRSNTDC
ncbi:hypothetical protein SIO70_26520 [Chitinophaga sancti]|uniref:hypothetical protein n=1 Tax=Chitinophaga sancti TaxID=1004 RepID=UPI002A7555B5|nr:hypothetical protein [Chitinophaga sancti]WPQ61921.1 hypothetical protein SIO70_26520 [Chitinophaga sancti]